MGNFLHYLNVDDINVADVLTFSKKRKRRVLGKARFCHARMNIEFSI